MSGIVWVLIVAGLVSASIVAPTRDEESDVGVGIRMGLFMGAVYVAVIGTVLLAMGWLR